MLAACSSSSSSVTRLYTRSIGTVGQWRPLREVAASVPSPSTSSPSKPLPAPSSLARTRQSLKRDAAGKYHSQLVERPHRQPVAREPLDSLKERIENVRRQERMTAITRQLNQQRSVTPAVVNKRIQRICEAEGLEKALEMLRSLPLNLQTPIAWNIVVMYALRQGRFQLAFKLFNEMKRRGLNPTPATYNIFASALSNSDSPSDHPKHIEMAHSLLEQYKQLAQSVTKGSTNIIGELDGGPFSLFIKYFGRLGDFDTVFNIYNSMEDECGVIRNKHTFSALFYALLSRKTTSKTDGLTISQQNALDVRLLWRDLERGCAKHRLTTDSMVIDSMVLTPALQILRQGRESDFDFAFELVQDYIVKGTSFQTLVENRNEQHTLIGMCAGRGFPRIPVGPDLMSALLGLCNAAGRPEECLEYIKEFEAHVERVKVLGKTVARWSMFDVNMLNLDKFALHQCIVAYAMLANPSSNKRDGPGIGREDEMKQSQATTTTTATEMETRINDRLYAEDALDLIRWSLTESAVSGVPPVIIHRTWNIAFLLCWREDDWATARDLFKIMLRYLEQTRPTSEPTNNVDTAQSQSRSHAQRQSRKPTMFKWEPSLIVMNNLAQTALSNHGPGVYQEFLSLFKKIKIEQYVHYVFPHTSSDGIEGGDSSLEVSLAATGNRDVEGNWPNYSATLRLNHRGFLNSVKEICDVMLRNPEGVSKQEFENWEKWGRMCSEKLEMYRR